MREDVLQLGECLVFCLRQKDKSKGTPQDGCKCLHPVECQMLKVKTSFPLVSLTCIQ